MDCSGVAMGERSEKLRSKGDWGGGGSVREKISPAGYH